uniref:Probable zinc-binding domain-containing protein n=1 Tax=Spumella elongata TaxID=89044 RepID=A0A7S3HNS3_9STRA|mmetsp:Transcript_61405/g.107876  ORF Transcript_61405/g.107876 Transcript_61405/m.107876 type:complete len:147 (+) Transcript_61405:90-530(+)|eukprot:CAMPEP_0184997860 /NCGR_PEP_ID=MMETSP1098-20130426/60786_1 /TAXON_ID=89044 /ORGANISM="Spumella elongata, Strain CCAP 955/1" /LENGTH=146 /DNA_ID=CAMNT_0027524563 /DNA_START=84 /DNA_END=524 /DNA_ORIENTATION=+
MPPKTQTKKMCAKKNCTNINCPFPHPKPYVPPENALQPIKKFVSHGAASFTPPTTAFQYNELPHLILHDHKTNPPPGKHADPIRDEIRRCLNCRKDFMLTIDETEWFNNKGFYLPKRCKECRTVRRKNEQALGRADVVEQKNKLEC